MADTRCQKARCYSPVACEGWGYCRELNLPTDPMDANGVRPQSLIDERRARSEAVEELTNG